MSSKTERDKLRKQRSRAKQSEENKHLERERNAKQMIYMREHMSSEERKSIRDNNAKRMTSMREHMSSEERKAARDENARRMTSMREQMTSEERKAARDDNARRMTFMREQMSSEERKAARDDNVRRMTSMREQMSSEERRAARDDNARRMTSMREQMSSEERRAALNANAKNMNLFREGKNAEREKKRATFALEDFDESINFYDFEQHPETAVLLYHMNSGHGEFNSVNKLVDLNHRDTKEEEINILKDTLMQEIKSQLLTPEEENECVNQFATSQGKASAVLSAEPTTTSFLEGLPPSDTANILICGCCGMTNVQGRYNKYSRTVLLKDLPSQLQVNGEQLIQWSMLKSQPPLKLPVDDVGNFEDFHLYKLHSIYDSEVVKKSFYLHPESVHWVNAEEEATVLCHVCFDWYQQGGQKGAKPPEFSLASGLDFGNPERLKMAEPSIMEKKVISKVRHFHNVVKIHPNQESGKRTDGTRAELRGGCIAFRDHSPQIASLGILWKQLSQGKDECLTDIMKGSMTIQLVGSDGQMEKIMHSAKYVTHLRCRAYVLYQWLAVLHACHQLYKNDVSVVLMDTKEEAMRFKNFLTAVQKSNKSLHESFQNVTSETLEAADLMEGDDVAQVRTRIRRDSEYQDEGEGASNNIESVEFSHSYVSEKPTLYLNSENSAEQSDIEHKEEIKRYVQSIAEAFDVDLNDHDKKVGGGAFDAPREEVPLNEFTEFKELLTGAFPDVFLFGKTYDKDSLLNAKQLKHLLFQFTNRAGKSKELLFYLYDATARKDVTYNFNCKVRRDPKAFEEYSKLVNSDGFRKKMKIAAQNPSSEVAKEVLRTVLPVLSFGSRTTVPGSLAGDTGNMARGMATAKRYGPASTFLTVTPDDINNPTSLRLCIGDRNNQIFPACTDEEFFSKLKAGESYEVDGESGTVRIPLDYTSRMKYAVENPVAVAREFQSLMEDVIQILIGCPLDYQEGNDSKRVRTWYFKSKDPKNPYRKGVYGHINAFYGCVETQGRGALHFHMILYGGISPKLLENAVGFEDICDCISSVLDQMHDAMLPRSKLIAEGLRKQMLTKGSKGKDFLPNSGKAYCAMFCIPCNTTSHDFEVLYNLNKRKTNLHIHTFTCKKPPSGRHRCRGGYPCLPCERTGVSQLKWDPEEEHTTSFSKIVPHKCPEKPLPRTSPKDRDYLKTPVTEDDERLFVWELARPSVASLAALHPLCMRAFEERRRQLEGISDSNKDDEPMELEEATEALLKGKKKAIQRLITSMKDNSSQQSQLEVEEMEKMESWLNSLEPDLVIAYYLKMKQLLEEGNNWVVSTNRIIQVSTGSSVNSIFLGNVQQSSASLFYVIPYLTKDKAKLEACLIALEHAKDHVQKHPSVASDSGTDKRTVQHMLTRVVNVLSRTAQVSDTQVALKLLGQGTEITSDSFSYCGLRYGVNYMRHFLLGKDPASDEVEDDAPYNRIFDDDFEEDSLSSDSWDNDSYNSKQCNHQLSDNQDLNDSLENAVNEPVGLFDESFGPSPLYKTETVVVDAFGNESTETKHVPVPYPKHWAYRGYELRQLTMYEYAATVDIKLRSKKTDEPTTSQRGRKKRVEFEFHSSHPLAASHVQVLKSKQPTLIVNAFPPKHPGEPPQFDEEDTEWTEAERKRQMKIWKKDANRFAEFYILSFFPHEDLFGEETHQLDAQKYLSWEAFCERTKIMTNSTLLIDKVRLACMFTFMKGFRSNFKQAQLLSNYRFQNTTRWSTVEKETAKSYWESLGISASISKVIQTLSEEGDCFTFKSVSFTKVKNHTAETQFCDAQNHLLRSVTEEEGAARCHFEINDVIGKPTGNNRNAILETASRTQKACLPPLDKTTTNCGRRNWSGQLIDYSNDAMAYLNGRNLSKSQRVAIDKIYNYFCKVDAVRRRTRKIPSFQQRQDLGIEQPTLLMTGEPGSGKSYVSDTIIGLAETMHMGTVGTTSYNGIAAVNVDGMTLTSMFNMFNTKEETLTQDQINILRQKIDADSLCFLIVDEVSTLSATLLAFLELRLQQIFGNEHVFGGVPILFAGDFNQLGPVKKEFLPKSMMAYARRQHTIAKQENIQTTKPSRKRKRKTVAVTMKEVQQAREALTIQKKNNEKQKRDAAKMMPKKFEYRGCQLLEMLDRYHLKEQQRASEDQEQQQFVRSKSEGQPIHLHEIEQFQVLSAEDVSKTGGFRYATILISSNRERHNLCREKAKLFAKDHNTYVIKWKMREGGAQVNRPPEDKMAKIVEENAFCWQYFVKGAPAYLSKSINVEIGLVNGLQVELDSLTLSNEDNRRNIEALSQGFDALPFGSEIEINRPLSVNVKISETLDDKPLTSRRTRQIDVLRSCSIENDSIVIPLTETMANKESNSFKQYWYKTGDILAPLGAICTAEVFPFHLAFAMTVHKAQGRTIDCVIIDLTKRPSHYNQMTYASVFVALSRCKRRKDIRLLRHDNKSFEESYKYLTELKPQQEVVAFYHGFEPQQNDDLSPLKWNWQKALSYKPLL